MEELNSTDYIFLRSPFWSEGGEMIKSTIQELCLKNVLSVEERYILVHHRDKVKRKRLFLKTGPNYRKEESYLHAENFILKAFVNHSEISFSQLRNFLKFHFKKNLDQFKDHYVYLDLKSKRFIYLKLFLTQHARKKKNELKKQLDHIDSNIDVLLSNGQIQADLESLGFKIILLKKETIKKIKEFDKRILSLGLTNLDGLNNSFNSIDTFFTLNGFDAIDSYDFAGASDFDFGGGDFGGGGAGGDW